MYVENGKGESLLLKKLGIGASETEADTLTSGHSFPFPHLFKNPFIIAYG